MPTPLRLACLDIAGTTVSDDGLVMAAFIRALERTDIPLTSPTLEYVTATMGQSKIQVFTAITGEVARAHHANSAFEAAYAELVAGGVASLIPGAFEALSEMRELGMKICLTTGFAPATRDLLVDALDLRAQVDLVISPQDTPAGRGRPAPDMILTALMLLDIDSVDHVAVAGDTASDIHAGLNSGASVVAGVLTGMHDEPTLRSAGPTHILTSIAELPDVCRAVR
ncbi:unannotated protein [freshwater metagenome]|uniref:Unannotated protein n=1 Tax=freshwater metagenome TaxID=449393 RepID=A0A6J7GRX1_9ZZZZ|nr:HAD hydrolase-like protein [Actinomycetota bacterium]